MGLVLSIVAPVFGLIALGFLSGRIGLLGPNASKGITDFAFKLAIPALLFRTIATANFSSGDPILIWITFFGAAAITWCAATLITIYVLRRPALDAPPISMTSSFGNTVMLGLPLSLATFGHDAAVFPAALILSLHAPVLWLAAAIHAAVARGQGLGIRDLFLQLFKELSANPIIIGVVAGLLWAITGLSIPDVILKMLDLLSRASVPSALIALGLSLINFQIKGQTPTLVAILVLKLLFMPLTAYVLGHFIIGLPPTTTAILTLMASVPTGVNAYLFANRHERAVNSTSGAIALGTAIGAITVSLIIATTGPH